jgi:predicted enzyme related to lactoylglutathione lyase
LGNNSNYNKVGYIEIPTANVEETKEFYSKMFGWECEKSKKEKEEEKVKKSIG